jgi:hypothetical protein
MQTVVWVEGSLLAALGFCAPGAGVVCQTADKLYSYPALTPYTPTRSCGWAFARHGGLCFQVRTQGFLHVKLFAC